MKGNLAISLAGHDKDKVYMIIREENSAVYLADGDLRSCQSPKRKNRKHIQPVHAGLTPDELESLLANPALADTTIKRCIKLFNKKKPDQED